MSIFSYIFGKPKEKSAQVARERLQLVIAHERDMSRGGVDFLPELKRELLQVISRYLPIDPDNIAVHIDRQAHCEVLEVNITLPEK